MESASLLSENRTFVDKTEFLPHPLWHQRHDLIERHPDMQDRSRARRGKQLSLGIALLVSCLITGVIYVGQWLWWTPAHNGWLWAVTSLAILASLVTLFAVTLWNLFAHRSRVWTLGWFMLASTPVVWVTCLSCDALLTSHARGNLRLTAPLRIAGVWLAGAADFEARLRYPRRVRGRHVELIDAGNLPHVEDLVDEMDQHVIRLSGVLDRDPPKGYVEWVRGRLLGFRGRNILRFAINDSSGGNVDHVDYHESAHAVITCLAGPHQNPGSLLAEGWAQQFSSNSQTRERNHAIVVLSELRKSGMVVSLDLLVSIEHYSRPRHEAYSHGSAFVAYLLERFGGSRFFDLYRQVRPATFSADVERILGTSWKQLENDFWRWLDEEAAKLPPKKPASPGNIQLASGVDPDQWQAFIDGCRASQITARTLPTSYAFEAIHQGPSDTYEQWTIVRRGNQIWTTEDGKFKRWDFQGPDRWVSLVEVGQGAIENTASAADTPAVVESWRQHQLKRSVLWAQLHSHIEGGYGLLFRRGLLVKELASPPENDGSWYAVLQVNESTGRRTYELELSETDFQIARIEFEIGGEKLGFQYELNDQLGVRLPVRYSSMSGDRTTQVRALTQNEAEQLIRDVEAMMARGPDRPRWYRNPFPSLATFPAYWLASACLLMIAHFGCRRSRGGVG